MSMERCWNDTGRGKSKSCRNILFQCDFVHHKSHAEGPEMKPGPPHSGAFKSCWPVLQIGYTVERSTKLNTMRSESRCALRLRYVDLVQACIDARGHHFQHFL
jgi:hypothetical protein